MNGTHRKKCRHTAKAQSRLTPNTNSCIAIYCIGHEWHFHFTGIIIQNKKIPQRTFPKGFQVRPPTFLFYFIFFEKKVGFCGGYFAHLGSIKFRPVKATSNCLVPIASTCAQANSNSNIRN